MPDLVYNRQGVYTPEGTKDEAATRKAFGDLLNGARLVQAWEAIPEDLTGSDEHTVLLYEDHLLTIKASPKGSCGYLYIAACMKPRGDGKWSGKGDVPNLGDKVDVMVNGIGTGRVLGHITNDGYMGVAVLPDKPWTKGGAKYKDVFVYGAELEGRPTKIVSVTA